MNKIQKKFLLISCLFIAAPLKISAVLTTKQAYANLNTALEAFKKNPTQNSAKDLEDAYKQIAAPAVKKAVDVRIQKAGVDMAEVKTLSTGKKLPESPASEETIDSIAEEKKAEIEADFAAAQAAVQGDSEVEERLEDEKQKEIDAVKKIQAFYRRRKDVNKAQAEFKQALTRLKEEKKEEFTKKYNDLTEKLTTLTKDAKKELPQQGIFDWLKKSIGLKYQPNINKLSELRTNINNALTETKKLDALYGALPNIGIEQSVLDANKDAEDKATTALLDIESIISIGEIAKENLASLQTKVNEALQQYEGDKDDSNNKKRMENLRAGIVLRARNITYGALPIELTGGLAALENRLADALKQQHVLQMPKIPSGNAPAIDQQPSGTSSSAPKAPRDTSTWTIQNFEDATNELFDSEDADVDFKGDKEAAQELITAINAKLKEAGLDKTNRAALESYKQTLTDALKK